VGNYTSTGQFEQNLTRDSLSPCPELSLLKKVYNIDPLHLFVTAGIVRVPAEENVNDLAKDFVDFGIDLSRLSLVPDLDESRLDLENLDSKLPKEVDRLNPSFSDGNNQKISTDENSESGFKVIKPLTSSLTVG